MNKEESIFKSDGDFEALVKKAKRKSFVRNMIISVAVTIVLFYGLYALGSFVMQKSIEKESSVDSAWRSIQGANVEEVATSYNYTPFSGVGTTEFMKQVGERPIPWGDEEKVFTMFGTSNVGGKVTSWSIAGVDEKRIPMYFEGQRMVEFFHPLQKYERVFDERPLLDEIDENKWVEFAFSFDKPYSIEEVEDAFSDHLAWYWVDTVREDELEGEERVTGITGNEAFGFLHNIEVDGNGASGFIYQLEWLVENGGNHQASAKEIAGNLTGGTFKSLLPEDLKVTGVVVTGSPRELKVYDDVPVIRAATLGATVDKY